MFSPQLPPPANWQDFESMCLAIWRELWGDPAAQKNGRQGQPQAGVDVFGRIAHTDGYHGVQCKLKDSFHGGELTLAEIQEEVAKASLFRPPLLSFTIATTARRDAALQEKVRTYFTEGEARATFSIQVYSWDDIVDVIAVRPHLIKALYPELYQRQDVVTRGEDGSLVGILNVSSSVILECAQIFDEADFRALMAEELRIELRNVATELALNAAEHGNARRCWFELTEKSLVIRDDGTQFDPLLPPRTGRKGSGLIYFEQFRAKRAAEIEFTYAFKNCRNTTVLRSSQPWSSRSLAHECTIILKQRYTHGPILSSHAEFPEGCEEYSLDVPFGFFNPSSLIEFLIHFFSKLMPSVRLRLRFARGDLNESVVRYCIATGDAGLDPKRLIVEQDIGDR